MLSTSAIELSVSRQAATDASESELFSSGMQPPPTSGTELRKSDSCWPESFPALQQSMPDSKGSLPPMQPLPPESIASPKVSSRASKYMFSRAVNCREKRSDNCALTLCWSKGISKNLDGSFSSRLTSSNLAAYTSRNLSQNADITGATLSLPL